MVTGQGKLWARHDVWVKGLENQGGSLEGEDAASLGGYCSSRENTREGYKGS